MKFLLLFLLLPCCVYAQQDFDYAVYTRHAQYSEILKKDSAMPELAVERRIVKEGSRLLIIPCMNTGNTQEYHIQFQGFSTHKPHEPMNNFFWGDSEMTALEYATEDQKRYIRIWPMVPLIEIYEFIPLGEKLLSRYY